MVKEANQKEAMFYEKLPEGKVRCFLCNHRCRISPGELGICGVRKNEGGKLFTLVYGRLISRNIDPIEKKPLFHFHPGSSILSLATVGCNFRCPFCQNADISQMPRGGGRIVGRSASREEIVKEASTYQCKSIAYTYTEPTIFFEYAYDIAKLGREKGMKNVFVTNGYMSEEALVTISGCLDAANVDLKSFREEFYQKLAGAKLAPVLKNLEKMKKLGIWVEVTTLVIPGYNDSREELKQIAEFVLSLGPETPWHVSRFYPTHGFPSAEATSQEKLREARALGLEAGLHYVYTGNVPGEEGESTKCPDCSRVVIKRHGYQILAYEVQEGKCAHCGGEIAGVGL